MRKTILLLILTAAVFSCCAAFGEDILQDSVTGSEDWLWNPGSYNIFSGYVDLAEWIGSEVSISLSTNLQYGDHDEEKHGPVFTVVNGKRITMLNQSDTVSFTPEEGKPGVSFSGSLTLPAKEHVRSVQFRIDVADTNGNRLKSFVSTVSFRDNDSGKAEGSFYIPFDINHITYIIAGAAVLIWILVLFNSRRYHQKEKSGGQENADIQQSDTQKGRVQADS